jgi:hypothetical protein
MSHGSLPVSRRQRPWWCCGFHHAAEGEDERVEREVVAGTMTDLVVGNRVEILFDQPGWVVVVIWEAGGAVILAGQRDDGEAIISIG